MFSFQCCSNLSVRSGFWFRKFCGVVSALLKRGRFPQVDIQIVQAKGQNLTWVNFGASTQAR